MSQLVTSLAAASGPAAKVALPHLSAGNEIGPDHDRAIVRFAPPDIARRHGMVWDGLEADAVEVLRREPFEYGFRALRHLLIMTERGERDDGESLVEGLPASTLREFSRKLSFVPAGHQFFGWQKPRALWRVTCFYIDPRGAALDPELRFDETEFKPRLFFFDKDLWETAAKLKALSLDSYPGQRQYAEALGIVLAHELLHLNNGAVPLRQNARGGLAPAHKRRLAEYIEHHLDEEISLSTLAELAGLSRFHFSRAFKESFGLPPHRYLTSRRMEKAKDLLAEPEISVTQIGIRLGFSETSSFSTTFHKHMGITPTEYRRNIQ